jgi:hypothetical protein
MDKLFCLHPFKYWLYKNVSDESIDMMKYILNFITIIFVQWATLKKIDVIWF